MQKKAVTIRTLRGFKRKGATDSGQRAHPEKKFGVTEGSRSAEKHSLEEVYAPLEGGKIEIHQTLCFRRKFIDFLEETWGRLKTTSFSVAERKTS